MNLLIYAWCSMIGAWWKPLCSIKIFIATNDREILLQKT
jgi:hypothetical protein